MIFFFFGCTQTPFSCDLCQVVRASAEESSLENLLNFNLDNFWEDGKKSFSVFLSALTLFSRLSVAENYQ
jgi:hypothetical protein